MIDDWRARVLRAPVPVLGQGGMPSQAKGYFHVQYCVCNGNNQNCQICFGRGFVGTIGDTLVSTKPPRTGALQKANDVQARKNLVDAQASAPPDSNWNLCGECHRQLQGDPWLHGPDCRFHPRRGLALAFPNTEVTCAELDLHDWDAERPGVREALVFFIRTAVKSVQAQILLDLGRPQSDAYGLPAMARAAWEFQWPRWVARAQLSADWHEFRTKAMLLVEDHAPFLPVEFPKHLAAVLARIQPTPWPFIPPPDATQVRCSNVAAVHDAFWIVVGARTAELNCRQVEAELFVDALRAEFLDLATAPVLTPVIAERRLRIACVFLGFSRQEATSMQLSGIQLNAQAVLDLTGWPMEPTIRAASAAYLARIRVQHGSMQLKRSERILQALVGDGEPRPSRPAVIATTSPPERRNKNEPPFSDTCLVSSDPTEREIHRTPQHVAVEAVRNFDTRDGARGWDHAWRDEDQKQWGSYPIHDNYDDESSPK